MYVISYQQIMIFISAIADTEFLYTLHYQYYNNYNIDSARWSILIVHFHTIGVVAWASRYKGLSSEASSSIIIK